MQVSKIKYILLIFAYLGVREWKDLKESCQKAYNLFDSNNQNFITGKLKLEGNWVKIIKKCWYFKKQ
jgi:hypothetical protein